MKGICAKRFPGSRSVLPVAVAAVLATGSPVSAQLLEEVLVTAHKRTQRIIDVPTSMTAFDDATLRRNMATGLEDYFQFTPNVASSVESALALWVSTSMATPARLRVAGVHERACRCVKAERVAAAAQPGDRLCAHPLL